MISQWNRTHNSDIVAQMPLRHVLLRIGLLSQAYCFDIIAVSTSTGIAALKLKTT